MRRRLFWVFARPPLMAGIAVGLWLGWTEGPDRTSWALAIVALFTFVAGVSLGWDLFLRTLANAPHLADAIAAYGRKHPRGPRQP